MYVLYLVITYLVSNLVLVLVFSLKQNYSQSRKKYLQFRKKKKGMDKRSSAKYITIVKAINFDQLRSVSRREIIPHQNICIRSLRYLRINILSCN